MRVNTLRELHSPHPKFYKYKMKPNLPKFITNKKLQVSAAGLTLISAALFFAPGVLAVSSGAFSAAPSTYSELDPRTRSWFIYTYSAGETRKDSVTLENKGTEPLTVKVYPADSTTTSDGAFALESETDKRDTIGAWVKVDQDMVTISPNEKKEIPFTISVPKDAQKGEYSGGVVFENTTPQNYQSKNMNLEVVSRLGVRVYLTVPGPEQVALEVKDLKYTVTDNNLNFSFTAENTGEVRLKPTGMLQIKDAFGRIVESIPLDAYFDILLPKSPVTINVSSKTLSPILGWNTANVSVYYSPTKAASANIVVTPNVQALAITLFVGLSAITLALSKKFLAHKDKKTHKTVLAPHLMVIVGVILLTVLLISGFIANFLKGLI